MEDKDLLIEWAKRLQSLAQAGLTYGKDNFDLERYQEIRDISAEIMAYKSDLPIQKVKDLFCNEIGYQTPKLGTRAAIFKDNKILLVQENDGSWSLPGGWCEVNMSVKKTVLRKPKKSLDSILKLKELSESMIKISIVRPFTHTMSFTFSFFVNHSVVNSRKILRQLLVSILLMINYQKI